ncbi:hypothetical protein RJ640_020905 [Escallonia rubra]|uniref:Uncharacterized protein n=1 Tax=Escallonia rubra TaxID=112253 RepID=A0AA88QTS0_9ASTE|nr:hypothetical protein RJ640_020905 [Escallonia rubra]
MVSKLNLQSSDRVVSFRWLVGRGLQAVSEFTNGTMVMKFAIFDTLHSTTTLTNTTMVSKLNLQSSDRVVSFRVWVCHDLVVIVRILLLVGQVEGRVRPVEFTGGRVVGHGGRVRGLERAEPDAGASIGLADLGHPFAPGALADALIFSPAAAAAAAEAGGAAASSLCYHPFSSWLISTFSMLFFSLLAGRGYWGSWDEIDGRAT